MKTWEIPKPPGEEVQRVWDGEGMELIRVRKNGKTWRDAYGPVSWDEMITMRGPITDEPSA